MKEGPNIAAVAALIGDPARSNILTALMSGKALTASELAGEAGVTLQTTSTHLSRLLDGGMLAVRKQGRHKYFSLAGPKVAEAMEALMGLAAAQGHLRTRTGPRDEALRSARVCYNHLAGAAGVQLYESLIGRRFLTLGADGLTLTAPGREFAADFGIDLAVLENARAPMCRECLDWSERRSHLGGRLGRAMLDRMIGQGWFNRAPQSRALIFTQAGRRQFEGAFITT